MSVPPPISDEARALSEPGDQAYPDSPVVVVVIGRNEGNRLLRCLETLAPWRDDVTYVDSGSTDGSVDAARERGASVVPLSLAKPFTAARARNAGFERATSDHPRARYVQFIDGDCEIAAGWISAAVDFLNANPRYAAACGRLRERHPEQSVYNYLCDIEWDTPIGDSRACGGIAMFRAEALRSVGGFREDLIAGEEPELCVRLRQRGWLIRRIDAEMALHDAAITRFGQWWKRAVRAGYAFAQGAALHGAPPERHWVRESRSALFWGLAAPAGIALGAVAAWPYGLLAALVYPLQYLRLVAREPGPMRRKMVRPAFLIIGKFAEAIGNIRFRRTSAGRQPATLIEYK